MIYQVKATFNYDLAQEFYQKLTDGSVLKQKPDGAEIVNSMNKAKIGGDGKIIWTELCYCPTPLRHERATFYDRYFSNFNTEIINEHKTFEGESFMEGLHLHFNNPKG